MPSILWTDKFKLTRFLDIILLSILLVLFLTFVDKGWFYDQTDLGLAYIAFGGLLLLCIVDLLSQCVKEQIPPTPMCLLCLIACVLLLTVAAKTIKRTSELVTSQKSRQLDNAFHLDRRTKSTAIVIATISIGSALVFLLEAILWMRKLWETKLRVHPVELSNDVRVVPLPPPPNDVEGYDLGMGDGPFRNAANKVLFTEVKCIHVRPVLPEFSVYHFETQRCCPGPSQSPRNSQCEQIDLPNHDSPAGCEPEPNRNKCCPCADLPKKCCECSPQPKECNCKKKAKKKKKKDCSCEPESSQEGSKSGCDCKKKKKKKKKQDCACEPESSQEGSKSGCDCKKKKKKKKKKDCNCAPESEQEDSKSGCDCKKKKSKKRSRSNKSSSHPSESSCPSSCASESEAETGCCGSKKKKKKKSKNKATCPEASPTKGAMKKGDGKKDMDVRFTPSTQKCCPCSPQKCCNCSRSCPHADRSPEKCCSCPPKADKVCPCSDSKGCASTDTTKKSCSCKKNSESANKSCSCQQKPPGCSPRPEKCPCTQKEENKCCPCPPSESEESDGGKAGCCGKKKKKKKDECACGKKKDKKKKEKKKKEKKKKDKKKKDKKKKKKKGKSCDCSSQSSRSSSPACNFCDHESSGGACQESSSPQCEESLDRPRTHSVNFDRSAQSDGCPNDASPRQGRCPSSLSDRGSPMFYGHGQEPSKKVTTPCQSEANSQTSGINRRRMDNEMAHTTPNRSPRGSIHGSSRKTVCTPQGTPGGSPGRQLSSHNGCETPRSPTRQQSPLKATQCTPEAPKNCQCTCACKNAVGSKCGNSTGNCKCVCACKNSASGSTTEPNCKCGEGAIVSDDVYKRSTSHIDYSYKSLTSPTCPCESGEPPKCARPKQQPSPCCPCETGPALGNVRNSIPKLNLCDVHLDDDEDRCDCSHGGSSNSPGGERHMRCSSNENPKFVGLDLPKRSPCAVASGSGKTPPCERRQRRLSSKPYAGANGLGVGPCGRIGACGSGRRRESPKIPVRPTKATTLARAARKT